MLLECDQCVFFYLKFKGWLVNKEFYVIMLEAKKKTCYFFFQTLNLLAERKQSCALKQ